MPLTPMTPCFTGAIEIGQKIANFACVNDTGNASITSINDTGDVLVKPLAACKRV
jgi:hypothetical protein